MKNYQKIYGLDTPRKIISRYAPPNENQTLAYIQSVSTQLGITPDGKVDLSEIGTLTVFSKLFYSRKCPKITFLKEKLDIFPILLEQEADFREKFKEQIDNKILLTKRNIHQKKENKRFFLSLERDKRAALPELDDKGNFNLERLALVHITRYKPHKNEKGNLVLKSLATATDLKYPRNTLHFTINHHVESHLVGDWQDAPYVIIVPFPKMLSKNGKPMGLSSVDTFFEVGLNEDLELPKETCFIEPTDKKLPEGVFSVTQGTRTVYKTKGFTEKERKILGCTGDIKDTDIATLVKKQVLHMLLDKQGYLVNQNFSRVDGNAAKIIERIGKNMGIPSTSGAALHSMIALSGINRFGKVIDCVYTTIDIVETILTADQIIKRKTQSQDEYEIHNKGQKKSFTNSAIEYYWTYLSEMKDLDLYLRKNGETDWLRKSTLKEKEIYSVWKQKSQQTIRILSEKEKHIDLEKFLEEKQPKVPLPMPKEKEY